MPADEVLRAAGYSLLLAGFLFMIRWWVLVAASLLCTLVAIMLTPGDS